MSAETRQHPQPKGRNSRDYFADEEKRIRYLKRLVDFSLALIAQSDLSFTEAQRTVEAVRQTAYRLFPDKKDTFELIYTPRFRRLIAEKFGLQ